MILTSTSVPVPFTPAWRVGKPDAPVFYLRAGSVIERGRMEAELAGDHDAAPVSAWDLKAAASAGVMALLADDPDLDRVLALIEQEGEVVTGGEVPPLTDEERRTLSGVRASLAEHWPEYRTLMGRSARRNEIAPIVALRRFCTGWDNATGEGGKPAAFARGPDGRVTEAALAALSPSDLIAAGVRAYALQYVGEEELGNSPPPSSSGGDPTTSGTAVPSPADGSSAIGTGRKTRATRSRRGAGRSSTSGSSRGGSPAA